MRYQSTRGRAPEAGFGDILLSGLAGDGGLYVPGFYPRVSASELGAWRELPYADLAAAIIGKFVGAHDAQFSHPALLALCRRTYTAATFGYGRPDSDATRIAPLRPVAPGLALLELSNGPTLAFKDMAMQLLGGLFEHALAAAGRPLNVLGATSGDTGSAAEYALRGRAGIRVFMLSPHGRMSAFQRAQMYTLPDANIFNLAVDGVFDDCQDLVKQVNGDADFKARWHLGAVNSINWGRIVAQVVYYFHGYFAATRGNDEPVSFAVPSGNFGNILAGWVARCMGLPIARLILATNENNVLDEFFRSGVYRVRSAAQTHATSSPSMDISKASNFERYVFDIVGRDPEALRELWWQLDTTGAFDLRGTPFWPAVQASGFASTCSTHADRLRIIRELDAQGLLVDPHTADGIKAARELALPGVATVCLETALPAKFAETIRAAVGREPPRPAPYADLETRPQRYERLPNDPAALKHFIATHAAS